MTLLKTVQNLVKAQTGVKTAILMHKKPCTCTHILTHVYECVLHILLRNWTESFNFWLSSKLSFSPNLTQLWIINANLVKESAQWAPWPHTRLSKIVNTKPKLQGKKQVQLLCEYWARSSTQPIINQRAGQQLLGLWQVREKPDWLPLNV